MTTDLVPNPYAPPDPAVTAQLQEFGMTPREALQFATVLAMGRGADREMLARLLAPSLVSEIATLRLAIQGGEDAPGHASSIPLEVIEDNARQLHADASAGWVGPGQAAEMERLRAWLVRAGDMLDVAVGNGLFWPDAGDPACLMLEIFEHYGANGWPETRVVLAGGNPPCSEKEPS